MKKDDKTTKDDRIFSIADKIATDLLKGKGLPFEDKWSKTSFGKLIDVQRHEIAVISQAYEDEIKDLNIAIEGTADRIGRLDAKIEELQDKLLHLEDENQILLKQIEVLKEGGKKSGSKSKVSQ